MRNVLLTWSLTSLFFTSVLLYAFATGHVERPPEDYVTHLTRR